jgi:hypothetical protein
MISGKSVLWFSISYMRTEGKIDGLSSCSMCSYSTRNLALHVDMFDKLSIYLIRNHAVILLVSSTEVYQRDHKLTQVRPDI